MVNIAQRRDDDKDRKNVTSHAATASTPSRASFACFILVTFPTESRNVPAFSYTLDQRGCCLTARRIAAKTSLSKKAGYGGHSINSACSGW